MARKKNKDKPTMKETFSFYRIQIDLTGENPKIKVNEKYIDIPDGTNNIEFWCALFGNIDVKTKRVESK